ncbi:iron-sulfur cluster repair di-iron protein [Marinoscillum sp. MHG1-6]|uniref:iron-sulfur cluster repair di-iron protein n=1 Tax=Marinoscillum sp. MHG1-6 TaxID=2959627 RepID=UPI002157F5DB|nr:iron-sulfur cluster repair di-iron protein [Marinoscillum sp. MHG1-6]
MKNLAQSKVGQIVAANYRTSTVFTAHNIDFCCGGGVTLEQACKDKNADLNEVLRELEDSFKTRDTNDYQGLQPDGLVKMITNVHHSYVSATIPALEVYLGKLCRVHGERHPELLQIADLFKEGSRALLDHMKKEELVLFPYILAMVEAKKNGFSLSKPHFQNVENPIQVMEHEHDQEGMRFRIINELSNNYECPPDGCQTYRVTYAMLKEFEEDLHKHIHLENNILFPAVRKLFQEFEFE